MGSVFSPYYALARRLGRADPLDHCAINVALYGPGGHRWAMTERGKRRVRRIDDTLAIGPSALSWTGNGLAIEIDEVTVPLPSRVRGVVRLYPEAVCRETFSLDADGAHRWSPIAPMARLEVAFEKPLLCWRGSGYFDSNTGDGPLENGFQRWSWSRAPVPGGTVVLYDAKRRNAGDLALALHFGKDGRAEVFAPPPTARLPSTLWRVDRTTRADAGWAKVVHTLEDTPFYARSVLSQNLFGQPATAVHESLSLDRFRAPWVQLMLPFRMPRRR